MGVRASIRLPAVLTFFSAILLPLSGLSAVAASDATQKERLRQRMGGISIPFIGNQGQSDPRVAFYASTFAGTVYVTRQGEIVYSLPATTEDIEGSSGPGAGVARTAVGAGWSLTETPVAGRAWVTAEERAGAQVNYFIGNDRSRWRSGIATYETVGLGEVWPGVRLSLRAHGDNVEKLFTV
ncbi:MAG: hypothetical protein ACRD1P_10140, partial [Thermoanaerobaculia bacterium]